jgi:hypothetical protein
MRDARALLLAGAIRETLEEMNMKANLSTISAKRPAAMLVEHSPRPGDSTVIEPLPSLSHSACSSRRSPSRSSRPGSAHCSRCLREARFLPDPLQRNAL